jgi:hypothetical protein
MSWRGLTWPSRTGLPITRPSCAVRPATSRKVRPQFRFPGIPAAPGFPGFPWSFLPGKPPVLAVSEFLPCRPGPAQEFAANNFKILSCPHGIHRNRRVIPRRRGLSTALSTAGSTGWPAQWSWWDWLIQPGPGSSPAGGAAMAGPAAGGLGVVDLSVVDLGTKDGAPPSMSWRSPTVAAVTALADCSAGGCHVGLPPDADCWTRSAGCPVLHTPS